MTETNDSIAVQARGVGKRYGGLWALQDCTIQVPAGSITALVGANGAGKSTLLQLLTGLIKASAGEVTVFGERPAQTASFLANVGYLAQEIPLYADWSAQDYIDMGRHLNASWDESLMRRHLEELSIPLDRAVGSLSGGQRAQVALATALAKRPKLLLLDEPVAALDPLARHDFLASLGQAAADSDMTVILSSHSLPDLETICDRLLILEMGRVQLADDMDHILATHYLLAGPQSTKPPLAEPYVIVQETHTGRQSQFLVQTEAAKLPHGGTWHTTPVSMEEIVLAYLRHHQTGQPNKQNGDKK